MDMQAFYTGHAFDAYEFFGAHTYFGGTHFAVWAPSAQYVQVVGEFGEYGMHRTCAGVWEADVNGADAGMAYQYRVYRCKRAKRGSLRPLRLCHEAAPRRTQHHCRAPCRLCGRGMAGSTQQKL